MEIKQSLWQSSYFKINVYFDGHLGIKIWLNVPWWEADWDHIEWVMAAWNLKCPDQCSDFLSDRQIPF